MELSPHGLTAGILTIRIQSLVGAYRLRSRYPFSALPLMGTPDASPKAISRRTSYHPVRLEFLPYAQLIPYFCSNSGFGPPPPVTADSSWPCVAHAGFGSNSCDIKYADYADWEQTIAEQVRQSLFFVRIVCVFIRTIHPRFHCDFVFDKT